MVPPAGGGPIGGWPRISRSGFARAGPARRNPATMRSPASPDPRPGSRVGPRLRRTGRYHMPRYFSPHEGFLNLEPFLTSSFSIWLPLYLPQPPSTEMSAPRLALWC
ncbi:hypothetical protein ILYODFUR_027708 [Ilyodon furcidens]|uniref:Uncharacterized protein n=1 Tax=Ilyodon furcidens TaxID=33524 RepID=A0ABV0TNE9_9TELE